MLALYLFFLPPSSTDSRYDRCRCFPLCSTTSSTTVYPYRRASRQEVPIHLSLILPICLYLSICTRHCCCYDCLPIQMHSLSLSPLVVPSIILCSLYYYILYNS